MPWLDFIYATAQKIFYARFARVRRTADLVRYIGKLLVGDIV